jgi:hypothetical protein
MTTYKDISISLSRNDLFHSRQRNFIIHGPGTVYYNFFSRKSRHSFLKPFAPCVLSIHPDWFTPECTLKATVIHLKIHLARHDGEYRKYKMDPWDLVVLGAEGEVPLPDEARLLDIANGVYGRHAYKAPLCIVNKEKKKSRFLGWWSRKGSEDRVVSKEVEMVLRFKGEQNERDLGIVGEESE